MAILHLSIDVETLLVLYTSRESYSTVHSLCIFGFGFLQSPDSECHIVQNALLLIFDRMMEVESNTRSTFEKTAQFSARALVLKHQFGCLVGLGGSIIKEMVNATGARIQILDDTEVPQCASTFELVIEASTPPPTHPPTRGEIKALQIYAVW